MIPVEDIIQLIRYKVLYKSCWDRLCPDARNQNFESELSENIALHLIRRIRNVDVQWSKDHKNHVGDLFIKDAYIPVDLVVNADDTVRVDIHRPVNEKIEIKAYTSTGPSSFGPNEQWHSLYFLDCRAYDQFHFKLYQIRLSNRDDTWRRLRFNSKETFDTIAKSGKRPRLSFENPGGIKDQLGKACTLIWEGNLR
jgi:hypothetical protein